MLIINPGTLANSSSHKTYAVLQIDQSSIKTQLYDLT
jgi:predicted phosphodiesterase